MLRAGLNQWVVAIFFIFKFASATQLNDVFKLLRWHVYWSEGFPVRDIVLDGKDEFDFFLGEVGIWVGAVIHSGHGKLLNDPTQIQSATPILSKISQENRVVQSDRQACTVAWI